METSKILTFLFLFTCSVSMAQDDLKIGEWRSHLPYKLAHYITQDDSKLYFTTDWSLYSINKDDGNVEFYSTVDGLSDVGANIVKYDRFNDVVLLFYDNSNLDIFEADGITNLPFISTSTAVGDKQVYDVFVASETTTYLAMGFGLKVLNVKNKEFGDELKAGMKFNSVIVYNNHIYAATDEGIYRVEQTPAINLQDFGEWELLDEAYGFPMDYHTNAMVEFEGSLYLDVNDKLMRYNGNSLDSVYQEDGMFVQYLTAEGQRLIVGLRCCIVSDDCDCSVDCTSTCNGKALYMESDGSYITSGADCINRPLYAIEDEKGQVWFADRWRPMRRASNYDADCDPFRYNSPNTQSATHISIVNNQVLVNTEVSNPDPSFIGDGFFTLVDGIWTTYSLQSSSALLNDMRSFVVGAINPSNNKMYAGTLWDGIIETENGVPINRHNANNSSLQYSTGDGNRVRVTGLAFDEENNLWVGNHTAPKPISVLKSDGTWTNDFKNTQQTRLRFLTIDAVGYKWFSIDGSGQALLVYDDAGTIDDKNDDDFRVINPSNSVLPSNTIFSLATDLDGDVWVGTNEGIVIFECGANALEDNCLGSRRIVNVGGFNTYLLESQEIRTIAVDGANRKWVGTNNGVFVLSPSGEEQLAFFDKDNSPLFDNKITAIEVNNETGEVFIGTAKGLISYRGAALEGSNVNSVNAYAYPNPVRPDYEGPIAIKGLARDANIKITDVNGQLVYETKALGGQAIWDGRDYNGRKANSGVYLVFSTNTKNLENPDAIVAKILFIN